MDVSDSKEDCQRSRKNKFVLISHVLPPLSSGQAIAIYQLLKNTPKEDYCLISSLEYNRTFLPGETCTEKLPGNYFSIPINRPIKLFVVIRKIDSFFNLSLESFFNILIRFLYILYIVKREKCSQIIGCSADLFDPYCAFLVSKTLGISFFFYAFDDYFEQWLTRDRLLFANQKGNKMLKSAKKIIVPNVFLKKHYDFLFGEKSIVIHNPVDLNLYPNVPWKPIGVRGKICIVYTGAIYEAHQDAFENLLGIVEAFKEYELVIEVYTQQNEFFLGLEPNSHIQVYKHQKITAIPKIQQDADILFLPLAFNSKFSRTIINTASPGKMGEYLASGRPILVHAPKESFISWYFSTNNCGIVVDKLDPNFLKKSIINLISNEPVQRKISENAKKCAERDFGVKMNQDLFLKLLSADN